MVVARGAARIVRAHGRSQGFQGIRRARDVSRGDRRGRRVCDRAGVCAAVRAPPRGGRAGHAAVVAGDRGGGRGGCLRRGRGGFGPRAGRDGDGLFRGRLARARRRCDGDGFAQSEGVHRDEDRPARRAAGRRGVWAVGCAGSCVGACRLRSARRRRGPGLVVRHLAGVRRSRAGVHRHLGGSAAEGGDRRGERDGWDDAAAGAGTAARRRGALLLRAGRFVPEP